MILRPPLPGEIPGTLQPIWAQVAEENGTQTGYVCASIFENAAWIHELHYWGQNPHAVTQLIKKTLKQIKSWGFQEVLVNTYNPKIQRMLEKHNFKVTQLIMKGEISR